MGNPWKQKRSRRFFVLIAGGFLIPVLILGGVLSYSLYEAWHADPCGPQASPVVTSLHPVGAQSAARFYAGSSNYLYALGGTTPGMLWCRHLVSNVDGSSQGIWSIQQSGGQVYVSMVNGSLLDVDGPSGAIRWSQNNVLDDVVTLPKLPPAVENGMVYGAGRRDVSALNAGDGSVRWRYTLPENHTLQTPLTVVGGMVYFGAKDPKPEGGGSFLRAHLYAVDAFTGNLRWDKTWPNMDHMLGPVVVGEGRVYVIEGSDLYALDAKTGKQLWRTTGIANGLLMYSQGLIYNSSSNDLKALDASNGTLRWTAPGEYGEALLMQSKSLYVGPTHGSVTALDVGTGKQLWQTPLALSADSSFKSLALRNGDLYIATQDIFLKNGVARNIIYVLNAQTGQEKYYITLATEGLDWRELSLTI